MHRLDGHINNIEPRIKAIYENISKQEEPSLQESLSSYGWILLDSWVAWRTLRFLLKETYIDEGVNKKWFNTPSSYTASQLKAIWRFNDATLKYAEEKTGKSFKELIDNTIQKKRNASAHFTGGFEVQGQDATQIKNYYEILSKVFLFYETGSFLKAISVKMSKESFCVVFGDDVRCTVDEYFKHITNYVSEKRFRLIFADANHENCSLVFSEDGCFAEKKSGTSENNSLSIVNDSVKKYDFFTNKGFYCNVELFVKTVEEKMCLLESNIK